MELADAYRRAGLSYYPSSSRRRPNAAPAPSSSSRPAPRANAVRRSSRCCDASCGAPRGVVVTGLLAQRKTDWLERTGLLRRTGCQFHWRNEGFTDFDSFSRDPFPAEKRQKLKRSAARDGGLDRLPAAARRRRTRAMAFFHDSTQPFIGGAASATLSLDFFLASRSARPSPLCGGGRQVEGPSPRPSASSARTPSTAPLGCRETTTPALRGCYYQGLDYLHPRGLALFGARGQGEHKAAAASCRRQLVDALIADPRFRTAIDGFLAMEAAR